MRRSLGLAVLALAFVGCSARFVILESDGEGQQEEAPGAFLVVRGSGAQHGPAPSSLFSSMFEPVRHPVSWLQSQMDMVETLQRAALGGMLEAAAEAQEEAQVLPSVQSVGCHRFKDAMLDYSRSQAMFGPGDLRAAVLAMAEDAAEAEGDEDMFYYDDEVELEEGEEGGYEERDDVDVAQEELDSLLRFLDDNSRGGFEDENEVADEEAEYYDMEGEDGYLEDSQGSGNNAGDLLEVVYQSLVDAHLFSGAKGASLKKRSTSTTDEDSGAVEALTGEDEEDEDEVFVDRYEEGATDDDFSEWVDRYEDEEEEVGELYGVVLVSDSEGFWSAPTDLSDVLRSFSALLIGRSQALAIELSVAEEEQRMAEMQQHMAASALEQLRRQEQGGRSREQAMTLAQRQVPNVVGEALNGEEALLLEAATNVDESYAGSVYVVYGATGGWSLYGQEGGSGWGVAVLMVLLVCSVVVLAALMHAFVQLRGIVCAPEPEDAYDSEAGTVVPVEFQDEKGNVQLGYIVVPRGSSPHGLEGGAPGAQAQEGKGAPKGKEGVETTPNPVAQVQAQPRSVEVVREAAVTAEDIAGARALLSEPLLPREQN